MSKTTEERRITNIFLEALQQVAPNLRAENIDVEEQTYKPEPFPELSTMNQALAIGLNVGSASDSVTTHINFVDFELPFNSASTLHAISCELTGVLHSYNAQFIDFHGSSKALLKLLDPEEFKAQIKERIPALET